MSTYPAGQTVKEAIQLYFKTHNLGEDGGMSKAWAKVKIGPFYLPIPNPPARKKVLMMHDMHHIATGYSGEWIGEVSISAWELASGCGKYWVAWVLDLSAMAIGLFIYPKATYNAFIRGRRTRNLYTNTIPTEEGLAMKIEELRDKLGFSNIQQTPATNNENLSFVLYSLLGLILLLGPSVALIATMLLLK